MLFWDSDGVSESMLVMAVSWHDLRVLCEVVAVGFDSAEFILEKTRGILLFTSKVGRGVGLAFWRDGFFPTRRGLKVLSGRS